MRPFHKTKTKHQAPDAGIVLVSTNVRDPGRDSTNHRIMGRSGFAKKLLQLLASRHDVICTSCLQGPGRGPRYSEYLILVLELTKGMEGMGGGVNGGGW